MQAADGAIPRPLLLFGAFDRHNFGDLLLARVAAALLPGRELHCAGLAQRDLRRWGGNLVQPLAALEPLARRGADLLHVGGELLDCSAWQAAAMLLPPAQAQATIAYLLARPRERARWTRELTGCSARAPYVAGRARLPGLRRLLFAAVGGVGLELAPAAMRAEVLASLAQADGLLVRDARTQALLAAAGIAAALVPDPAVLVEQLFGARIAQSARSGEVARLRAGFPSGHLAVQVGPEFADDATLARLATGLDAAAQASGCAIVLFRAGTATWHDDPDRLQRLAAGLRAPVRIMRSVGLWDICALIASARAYAGSSLHGRIVATAFGLPRLSLVPGQACGQAAKLAAYIGSWESPALSGCVTPDGLAAGLIQALAADPAALRADAQRLAACYREGWAPLQRLLEA